jgi:hypothetical protein
MTVPVTLPDIIFTMISNSRLIRRRKPGRG